MDINQASLQMHYDLNGKIEVISRKKIETREDLSLAYTPGVAEPCRVIARDYEQSFKLTRRSNLVAVITAPLFWALVTSALLLVCRLWRENAPCLRNLQMWTHSPCASTPRILIPLCRPSP